ncbi:Cuticle protein 7 [Portunus trituberculatus]|uniref:Cuticle protein 7 n=1 Tax=Portunus trituberculatus TaxID=210409 RepID=A0A5B7GXM3_PORTR|nr:Cuticle protein 7 [Portunus trituberculatus]
MKVLLAAVVVVCCSATPVRHKLWKTYLYFENTNPAVVKIPKPDINLVETFDTQRVSGVVSGPAVESPVPSPVLVKRLDAPPTEEEVRLTPVLQKSPIPVPVPVLLTLEPVEGPEDNTVSVPRKELVADELADAQVVAVGTPVVVVAAPEPLEAPEPPMPSLSIPFVGGQFHAQDELKQYSFGHWGGPSTRVESRDAMGRTKGSFAYVNPDGDVHVRKYSAAPTVGFKVAASDLPDDTPEVARLKAAHEQAHLAFLSFKEEMA